ncbi:DUF1646 family protein [Candidatus Binatus sp.]|uniref:DUF1646 family protein n=1 Tax=Candidatus Binatus sp. TaxID=2811406 RepID=UPI0032C22E57
MARPGHLGGELHLRLLTLGGGVNAQRCARRRVRSGPAASRFWIPDRYKAIDRGQSACYVVRRASLDASFTRSSLDRWRRIGGPQRRCDRAGALRIGSATWAKIGVPMGLVLLGIYFAVVKLVG